MFKSSRFARHGGTDVSARRAGMRKAKVALARKLAVILHRMLADGKAFNPAAGAKTIAATA